MQANIAVSADAAQACQTCATQKTQQHRLRLIIQIVSEYHRISFQLMHGGAQSLVAQVAGRCLHGQMLLGSQASYIHMLHIAGQLVLSAKALHQRHIPQRLLASQAVLHMAHAVAAPALLTEGGAGRCQCHAIRAAADGEEIMLMLL